jgi:uncharacterized protein YecE (DUF72 family)
LPIERGRTAPRRGRIRVGIGGWNYAPWRETFYPRGTPASRELDYASRRLTSIEINGTFYRLQKPAVFAKWHDATPDDFVFSVKAPRFVVQRKDLRSAETSIARFLASGIVELKSKLGPILWQLSATKSFDAEELDRFLALLPAAAGKLRLRHALEVRRVSARCLEKMGAPRGDLGGRQGARTGRGGAVDRAAALMGLSSSDDGIQ